MVRCLITYLILFSTAHLFGQSFKVEQIKTGLKGNVFSPTYWKNDLIVCSDQKDRIYNTVKDANGLDPVDLYLVSLQKTDLTKRFDSYFRTEFHDGPISFSGDGNKVAISRNLRADEKTKQLSNFDNSLGIYFTQIKEGGYTKFESFIYNSETFNITHPFLNYEGNILYFSSNMSRGEGGYDIYYSLNESGIWKKPVNLGPTINTVHDEVFPSLDGSQLYFSSNRNEVGGLDIYSCDLNANLPAEILDTSINSIFDDFGLISKDGLENGYFSSNRNGKDGLYKFTYEYPEFGPCESLVETYFCYTIEDEYAADIEDLEGLVYVWNINGEKLYGVSIDYCFPKPGNYEITLDIEDTIVNQVFYEQSYLYISIQIEEQPYISCPDTVKLNESFQLSADKTYLPSLDIADEDYFWLINGTTRKRGENISHLFAKEGVYEVQLAVIGFDNEAEAQHCVYKTVVCGNPKTVDNDTIDLFTDNPKENKAVNIVFDRNKYANPEDSLAFYTIEIANGQEELFSSDFRLELLDGKYDYKLRYLEEEELFIYYVGEFETITEAHEFWKELRELGLQEAVVRTLLEQKGEISLDDIFVLNNVKFDSDQWKVREDAMPDLNLVVEIMGNLPDITLEINAYTDNTSSEDYNLELSKKRARSIASYLINKGVSASRVSEFGYGESNPIASNDSEQGKELNRRVEFILKTE